MTHKNDFLRKGPAGLVVVPLLFALVTLALLAVMFKVFAAPYYSLVEWFMETSVVETQPKDLFDEAAQTLTITFQGHLACPIFTQKTAPYPIKSGLQHRFFLSYSINSIIMLCAFCACSPIRQALSPAQNRSLPSPQSGQTNRPHKQSAGFSGQAGQCPGALSRSSA